MADHDSKSGDVCSYELGLDGEADAGETRGLDAVSEELARQNLAWYIVVRWWIAGGLVVTAGLAAGGLWHACGLDLGAGWLVAVGGGLAGLNVLFGWHRRRLRRENRRGLWLNVWAQIGCDLVAITVVVHMTGGQLDFVPFLYGLHIILGCIFLPRWHSLMVVLAAGILYGACVLLESVGVLAVHPLFHASPVPLPEPSTRALEVVSTVLLWVIMWGLVARLAEVLRRRECQLEAAERRSAAMLRETHEQMHQTSHQMKAPLDAVRSRVGLLREGLLGPLSPEVDKVLDRIDARCNSLSSFVLDMLNLARLKDRGTAPDRWQDVDLLKLVRLCVDALQGMAASHQVQVEVTAGNRIANPLVQGDPEALRMMFDNLISNAIVYSRAGGLVEVSCAGDDHAGPTVTIADHGIGIPAASLPRIFEEYYRTSEAKEHNPHSTGIGMAIVRHVARSHRVRLSVTSKVNEGTTFRLVFPPPGSAIRAPERGLP